MEDLDIIRHDIQPGRMQSGLQPGREPGSGGPRKSAADFRDLPRKSAADLRDLPRVRGRASKPAAGLQSIINKIITC